MADSLYLIKNETLEGIANAIRDKTNSEDKITAEQMAAAIEGIVVDDGLDTSDATAAAADILEGKTAYVDGNKIIGTIPTVSIANATISEEDSDTERTIEVTFSQPSGYISSAGVKNALWSLAFPPASTITPTTINQVVLPAGDYHIDDNHNVIVEGDSNLIASNIKSGISIFGVSGTYEAENEIPTDTTAVAADILEGKTAYLSGVKVSGTMPTVTINFEFDEVDSVDGRDIVCTVGTTGSGYISETNSGQIYYAYYAFPEASIITPSTVDQVILSSGKYYYASNNIIVAGDANLVANNIKQGVSIFGVEGTHSIAKTELSEYINRTVSGNLEFVQGTIGQYAFAYCTSINEATIYTCSKVSSNAFLSCTKLSRISFKYFANGSQYDLTLGNYAFAYCKSLNSVSCSTCVSVGSNAFRSCSLLNYLNLPKCRFIGNSAFIGCSTLSALYLPYSSIVTLSGTAAFNQTPMSVSTLTGSFGSIYVPSSLVYTYKVATNWTDYADRITAIEE